MDPIKNDVFPVLISAEEIQKKISQIAKVLNQKFSSSELVLLMVMKGSICFAADLIRMLHLNVSLEFITASRYGMRGMTPSREIELRGFDSLDLKGKAVLLVDDIFDTGITLESVLTEVKKKEPLSVHSLYLLAKKKAKKPEVYPDYVLFEIENGFPVGYGLDYKERFRGLKDICQLPREAMR